jgi:hypothetical protein
LTFADDRHGLEMQIRAQVLELPQGTNGDFVFAVTIAEG